ncbi:hypothetical protein [Metabacillus iocasae]|uniref:Uncharacterized protein n=1 Tax=Priestia iocasae TaxID=2291674 RepID=A0ABS2QVG1_9BACI|nr:hypothetical protein [Metabacillus iocasae]MBM7703188.1 hypothetical protein [Metabacillus iocasae]
MEISTLIEKGPVTGGGLLDFEIIAVSDKLYDTLSPSAAVVDYYAYFTKKWKETKNIALDMYSYKD